MQGHGELRASLSGERRDDGVGVEVCGRVGTIRCMDASRSSRPAGIRRQMREVDADKRNVWPTCGVGVKERQIAQTQCRRQVPVAQRRKELPKSGRIVYDP